MKIVQSISDIYDDQLPLVELVRTRVDKLWELKKRPAWHYVSRIKQKESFALKLETGRFSDPKKLEDFFACTLVVENATKFLDARQLVDENFEVVYQRPEVAEVTYKSPDAFPFDDIRLYAKLKRPEYEEEGPIFEVLFEIQIKTFLQHAWSIATHDLIYKSGELSWPKARVAYQVKAMLEQAEASISAVQYLAETPELKKSSTKFNELLSIIDFMTTSFDGEDLPSNMIILADNINNLLQSTRMSLQDAKTMLDAESAVGKGVNTKNLSPYMIMVQSMINQKPTLLETHISSKHGHKFKVLLTAEMDLNGLRVSANGKSVRI